MMEDCGTDQTEPEPGTLRTALLLGGTGEIGKQVILITIVIITKTLKSKSPFSAFGATSCRT